LAVELTLVFSLIAIVGLLVLSAFFSGSETALTAASRARIHHLERHGNEAARIVSRLILRRDQLIGAVLLGNNLVNILASSIATSILITFFGDIGVAIATVVMTTLVLIFAEILPKTYAISNADRAALAVAPVIRVLVAVLAPLTRALNAVVRGTLRLFGAGSNSPRVTTVADEIRSAIELHAREGHMVKHERDMLDSILDLTEVTVEEVMVHRRSMFAINAAEPASSIIDQVLSAPYTRVPLWRDDPDNIVGILHAKDVLRAVTSHTGSLDGLDIVGVASEPWFVPETTSLRDQLNAFRRRRAHVAMVVDEYGSLMGLVTLEDILEDIVGEIADEHDIPAPTVRALGDGSYVVDGAMTIRDLNRLFDWNLPDEEATTVAGLVIYSAQVIPEVGQVFVFNRFRFEILRRQRNQIVSLRVTPPARRASGAA
jgi:Mg2+/Co2+ transporter CorB